MKLINATGLIILTACFSFAQDYPRKEVDLSRLAEDLVGFQDQDANYEEIYENLVQILSNPIDLNTANAEQLRMLHLLDEKQIQQLLNYKETQSRFFSIYELQAVPE